MAIGMGLQAVGALGQGMAEKMYRDRLNKENKRAFNISRDARLAEQERQLGYNQEADQNFATTLTNFDRSNYDARHTANEAAFTDMLTNDPSADAVKTALPGMAGASDAVQASAARSTAKAAGEARERIKSLAAVSGHGGVGSANARTLGGAGDFLSILAGLRRGSLGVGQQEQSIAPADVQKGDTTLFDLMSGVGSLVSFGAGSGGGLFSGGGMPTMIDIHNPGWLTGGKGF